MSQCLSRLQCRYLSWTRLFDRACAALPDVGMLGARDRRGPTGREPCLNFRQVPDDAPRAQSKAPGKLTALFHFIDSAIGEQYYLAQLMSSDCPFERHFCHRRHFRPHR